MEFPALGSQDLMYQPPTGGSGQLACALGNGDEIGCNINGTSVSYKLDPAKAYAGQHAWALTYDRVAQTTALYFDGDALPAGSAPFVPSWSDKSDATADLLFNGTGKTIHEVRIWNRALTPVEIANEVAHGPCSTADPIRFNFNGDPVWMAGDTLPTTHYPADVVEPGFSGYAQPPPGVGPGYGGTGFSFIQLDPTNMASLDITTTKPFRVEYVTSYHDANIGTPFTMVAELSAPGETNLLAASGWQTLYTVNPMGSGEDVHGPVPTAVAMPGSSYIVRFRPTSTVNPTTTQVATAWFFMVGVRLPLPRPPPRRRTGDTSRATGNGRRVDTRSIPTRERLQRLEPDQRAGVRERQLPHLGGSRREPRGERLQRRHVLRRVLREEAYRLHHLALARRPGAVAEEQHATREVRRRADRVPRHRERLHPQLAELDHGAILQRMGHLRGVADHGHLGGERIDVGPGECLAPGRVISMSVREEDRGHRVGGHSARRQRRERGLRRGIVASVDQRHLARSRVEDRDAHETVFHNRRTGRERLAIDDGAVAAERGAPGAGHERDEDEHDDADPAESTLHR
jgi:hypothetical protein